MKTTLAAFLLVACIPEAEPSAGPIKPSPSCEDLACAHVADCAPVLTGGVDWRTADACMASGWTCYEPEACLDAVAALPCLPDGRRPTDEELDATTRAFTEVRRALDRPIDFVLAIIPPV